jgi:hypothetical protein
MYKAVRAVDVLFEPAVHDDYVLYSKGPKVLADGHPVVFTYPGEEATAGTRLDPSYSKLESIRMKAGKSR